MSQTSEQYDRKVFRWYGILGAAIIIVSEILMFQRVMIVSQFFTAIVWTGYILFMDALIFKLKGESLISNRTRELVLMLILSVIFWLIFEFYNFSIKNWHYINLPPIWWVRWLGCIWAFATILPGIFLTTELIEISGIFKGSKTKRETITKKGAYTHMAFGALCLIIPMILHSDYLSPLVWAGFIFLLEPINYISGGRSILRDLEQGTTEKFWSLMLAGLVCGVLWEFWNYWSYTKWIYTVPYPLDIKIFEMPILGWLGFPPFAVECYAMYNFARVTLKF